MSSTAAVVSSVNYHLHKQVSQEFSSKKVPNCLISHTNGDTASSAPSISSQNPSAGTALSDVSASVKLVSSNIDSALRTSLKSRLSSTAARDYIGGSMMSVTTADFAQRSLSFHESSAPPLDVVIRQKIENHPNSLILSESVPTNSKTNKHTLCTDSELVSWCRSASEHVPHQSLGLGNSGNTCYLNSVLQCLLATGPLLAYVNTKHCNSNNCFVSTGQLGPNKSRFCALCGIARLLRQHNQRPQEGAVHAASFSFGHILPSYFLANVRAVCPGFRPHQQEDAHEFLLGLLSRMEDSTTAGLGKIPRNLSETNAIRRIFGGVVRSEVTCHACRNVSARDEICFNLSVDITYGRSLQQCLFNYIHSEELCGQNAYKCEKCRQYRSATRRSTIFQGGPILIIQFNRFSRNQKLDTRVEFPSSFNLRPFMTDSKGPPVLYKLYGTVNHEGYSCRSGHYVAFTRRHGAWLSHNDSFVNSTNVEHVLRQTPYLLFYEAVSPLQNNSVLNSSNKSTDQSKAATVTNKPVKSPYDAVPTPVIESSLAPTKLVTPVNTEVGSNLHSVPTPVTVTPDRPPVTSVPRIIFNPNVKQRSNLTPIICTANTTTTLSVDSMISPSNSTMQTLVSTPSCKSAPSQPLQVTAKAAVKPVTPFTSTTVHQLLYGETSIPGLWSERPTPSVSNTDSPRKYNGKVRSKDDQHSSPRKRKHSSACPSPGIRNTASSRLKSSESSVDREQNSTTRNKHSDSSGYPSPVKHARRVSESSSDSSIVWVPKSNQRLQTFSANDKLLSETKRIMNGGNGGSSSSRDRPQDHLAIDRHNRKHRHRHHHRYKKQKHGGDRSPGYYNRHKKYFHTHRDGHEDRTDTERQRKRWNQHHNRHNVFHRSHNFGRSY